MLLEVCIDSVGDALAAERAGARRLELCGNLVEGGTTPSIGMLRAVVSRSRLPVCCMIRPRGGDFLYTADEIEVMLRDIEAAKACGAHGIVGGALHPDGSIDEEGTRALREAASPLDFTFHRAFDFTRDLDEALDVLMAAGVSRVLTSGGAATAFEGRDAISHLVRRAGARLVVMAGGGVRAGHIAQLLAVSGVRELHIGARREVAGGMRRLPDGVAVSKPAPVHPGGRMEADEAAIEAAVRAMA